MRIVTFGEILLRLKAPGRERLFQSPALEATFGGGEANVAVSLAHLGAEAVYVTAVPRNAVGDAAVRALRAEGVDTSRIARQPGRLGIYFLEAGADQRSSQVVYDRAGSAAAAMKPGDFDWPAILAGADWLHLTGITPALSQSAADATLEAAAAARAAGVRISIDLNFRKKLWAYGVSAPALMHRLASLADVVVANEEDLQLSLGLAAEGADPAAGRIDVQVYRRLAERAAAVLPNVSVLALTLRESRSADRNGWSAALLGRTGFHVSRKYELEDIIDRLGGGDSFAAGLIFGLLEYGDEPRALEFAAAASALKHSIPGDFNLVSRAEVERLAGGDASGRVNR